MKNYDTIVTGKVYQENCYILYNGDKAVLIDPGDEFKLIDETITKNNLEPVAILLTHGHFDHIGAVRQLKDKYNVKVYMNSDDNMLLSFMREDDFSIDVDIKNADEISVADMVIKCIKTPGHSKGSVCFFVDKLMFSGDTLFAGSIGRCDLPGGSANDLMNTLSNIIVKLDDDLKVLPGHGEMTTIGTEKISNYYLKNL